MLMPWTSLMPRHVSLACRLPFEDVGAYGAVGSVSILCFYRSWSAKQTNQSILQMLDFMRTWSSTFTIKINGIQLS